MFLSKFPIFWWKFQLSTTSIVADTDSWSCGNVLKKHTQNLKMRIDSYLIPNFYGKFQPNQFFLLGKIFLNFEIFFPTFLKKNKKIHGAIFSKIPKNTDFLEILPTYKLLHILSKKRLYSDWAFMDAELLKNK